MKWCFLGISLLFAVCLVLGLLLPTPGYLAPASPSSPAAETPSVPDGTPPETGSTSDGFADSVLAEFGSMADFVMQLPPFAMALFILAKNAMTLLFSFGFAPLLGLVPLFTVGFNGWLIGVVAAGVTQSQGLAYTVKGLLPHGIIEIPAFLLGEAVALSFAVTLISCLFRKEKRADLFPAFMRHLKWLGIAIALLVPAAFIEVFVTGRLIGG